MDVGYVVLRLLHVLSTVFWVGAAVVNIGFIVPAAGKAGPEGGKFMGVLLRGPLIAATNLAIVIAALSGAILFWRDSAGFRAEWIGSSTGIAIVIGALFGLAAAGVFGAITIPTFRAMVALGGEIAAAGGPPKPEQVARLGGLQTRSLAVGRLNAGLLVAALLFMVVGRSI
jgi:hypothetical protein